ncbi:MAG: beta-propeller domain-containing protein, partial [Pirellulales bacterium]
RAKFLPRLEQLEARQMLDGATGGLSDEPGLHFERFNSDAELEQFLVDDALTRYAGQFGQPTWHHYWLAVADAGGPLGPVALNEHSTTNTQVAGIDEGDTVETDGDYLYVLSGQQVVIIDALPAGEMRVASRTIIDGTPFAEYLAGDRLAVLSYSHAQWTPQPWLGGPALMMDALWPGPSIAPSRVQLTLLDVADPESPKVVQQTQIDGNYTDSRVIGDSLYLIINTTFGLPWPETHCTPVEEKYPAAAGDVIAPDMRPAIWDPWNQNCVYETQDEYLARIAGQVLQLGLPDYTSSGPTSSSGLTAGTVGSVSSTSAATETGVLHEATDVFRPRSTDDVNLVSVTVFDLSSDEPGFESSTGIPTTWTNEVYMSADHLYFANPDWGGQWTGVPATSILKIALDPAGGGVSLEAVGSVGGQTLNQFSLDEHEGYLRVATTSGWGPAAESAVYVLGQTDTRLEIVGSILHLAPGERMYSSRFMGDQGFVVTFPEATVRIDPLWTIDLSEPTNPHVVGELIVPGYSNYLQAIDEDHLIGLGHDADVLTGVRRDLQLSMFNVADFAHPALVDRYTFESGGGMWWNSSSSEATWDHHAVGFFPEYGVVAIPVNNGNGWISVDRDGDAVNDVSIWRPTTDLWVLKLDPDADPSDGAVELLGRVHHEAQMRRSLRIADVLYAVSDSTVTAHPILDPNTKLGEVHFGQELVGVLVFEPVNPNPVTVPVTGPDLLAPQVVRATVGSTSWTDAMVNQLEQELSVAPGEPSATGATVSYTQINQIKVQFSEDVLVGMGDLTVTGSAISGSGAAAYSIVGYQYEAGTHTGVWTLAAPLGAEQVTFRLAEQIEDLAGNGIDGDASGASGGMFVTSFDSLPGDVNHDRVVDRADMTYTIRRQFSRLGQTEYDSSADVNGDGVVNVQDLVRVRNLRGTSLTTPATSPTPPAVQVVPVDNVLRTRPTRSRENTLRLDRRAVDRAHTVDVPATEPVESAGIRRRR